MLTKILDLFKSSFQGKKLKGFICGGDFFSLSQNKKQRIIDEIRRATKPLFSHPKITELLKHRQ